MKKTCLYCHRQFNAHENRNKFCSRFCYHTSTRGKPTWNAGTKGVMKPNRTSFKKGHPAPKTAFKKGQRPHNWKGGIRYVNGYKLILLPSHPFATKSGYIREHHLVAEKCLKRYVQPYEVIHHINGILDDNRPSNLFLFSSNSKHRKYEGLKNKHSLKSNINTHK
jgi:hypothetical protein